MEKIEDNADAILKNHKGQELLFLVNDKIRNSSGQELGYFKGFSLFNYMDQKLGYIEKNSALNFHGQRLGFVENNHLFNANKKSIMKVDGRIEDAKVKIGLAYFFFLHS